MDTDVEVICPLDFILIHDAVSGFESPTQIPTGLMACRDSFPLFAELLRYYDEALFFNDDGTLNLTTNVETITKICVEKGLKLNNLYQEIEGFALYPSDYFCPKDWKTQKVFKTKNTVTIHWFSGSWVEKKSVRLGEKLLKQISKVFLFSALLNCLEWISIKS